MKQIKALLTGLTIAFFTTSALAQSPYVITNPANARFEWIASTGPNIVGYDIIITTNQTVITTNGYVPPAGAIISGVGVTGLSVPVRTVWSGITNGTYSVFVDARAGDGGVSVYSSNAVFRILIRPQPPMNVRVIQD